MCSNLVVRICQKPNTNAKPAQQWPSEHVCFGTYWWSTELILFVFVCLFLLFVIVIFCVYTRYDKPNVSCEIFLCVGATALCRFSFLLPSFNAIALSFTGCSTDGVQACFWLFECLVSLIRFVIFSFAVGCRHIKDKWNHKRYAVTQCRPISICIGVFDGPLIVRVNVKTRFQVGHCLGSFHTKVYSRTKWSVPIKISFI